jgi:hypothetical protein
MRTFVICLLMLGAVISCEKEDKEKPTINVTSPTPNQQFNAGEVVNIIATISDNNELHEVHLFVDKTTGGSVVHFMEHLDASTYNLSKPFTAEAGVTYQIVIQANDHADNLATATMEVSGN